MFSWVKLISGLIALVGQIFSMVEKARLRKQGRNEANKEALEANAKIEEKFKNIDGEPPLTKQQLIDNLLRK